LNGLLGGVEALQAENEKLRETTNFLEEKLGNSMKRVNELEGIIDNMQTETRDKVDHLEQTIRMQSKAIDNLSQKLTTHELSQPKQEDDPKLDQVLEASELSKVRPIL